ncbi:hypothetical protein [Edwardsiella tarda]|uniref:hypothetical protein n=1 Tax=Edwardsiella tarda TaxID=636 RepID=UPI003D2EC812
MTIICNVGKLKSISSSLSSVTILLQNDKSINSYIYKNILASITNSIDSLIETRHHLFQSCLHTRNLFELLLIFKKVNSGEEHLKSWLGQIHKDLSELKNGFQTLFDSYGVDTKEIDNAREFDNKSLKDSGLSSKGSWPVGSLSTEFGMKKEYDAIYRICSKLTHPSSLRVNFEREFINDNNYLKLVHSLALHLCERIDDTVTEIHLLD